MKSDKILNLIPILQELDEKSLDLVIKTAKSYLPTFEDWIKDNFSEEEVGELNKIHETLDKKIKEIKSKKEV